ncbi:MAG: rod shape-determining protein MreD [Myxococcota bacterium]
MRRVAVLLAAGLLALIVQSAAVLVVPYPFCPDLGLLVVVALGLHWAPLPSGFAMAAALGYATDVLSSSLLGQHALLRLLTFAAARVTGRQIHLRGALPLAVFAAGLTVAYAAALQAVLAFFTSSSPEVGAVGRTLVHAVVNALFAPPVAALVEWLAAWSGDDDPSRRTVRLEARGAR